MALFFDQEWFDRKLAAQGTNRTELAAILGVSEPEINDIWKDQREVSPSEVAMIAVFLDESRDEIASRCGVSTSSAEQDAPSTSSLPHDRIAALGDRLTRIEGRLARLEQSLADIHAALLNRRSGPD